MNLFTLCEYFSNIAHKNYGKSRAQFYESNVIWFAQYDANTRMRAIFLLKR